MRPAEGRHHEERTEAMKDIGDLDCTYWGENVGKHNVLSSSSDVAASLEESGDQHTLVTFAFSEKADDAMMHSGTSTLEQSSPKS